MKRLIMIAAAALAAMGMAASPAAAEDTGFDFNAWFNTYVTNPPDSIPEIEIQFGLSAQKDWIFCETRASYEDTPWCGGGYAPLFVAVIEQGYLITPNDPPLQIGIEWATATGQTGYGANVPVTISPSSRRSNTFVVPIPDDNIKHSCNKLIVNLRSLTPDRYKIAPFHDGGSIFIQYVDDDGGNPDNKPC